MNTQWHRNSWASLLGFVWSGLVWPLTAPCQSQKAPFLVLLFLINSIFLVNKKREWVNTILYLICNISLNLRSLVMLLWGSHSRHQIYRNLVDMETAGEEPVASRALPKPHPCWGRRSRSGAGWRPAAAAAAAAVAAAAAASWRPPAAGGSDDWAAPCCAELPSGRSENPANTQERMQLHTRSSNRPVHTHGTTTMQEVGEKTT